jgi:hypothetical protein
VTGLVGVRIDHCELNVYDIEERVVVQMKDSPDIEGRDQAGLACYRGLG